MRALVGLLLCINQQTKSDVLSFTITKDMIEAKLKNGSHDTDIEHAPFRDGLSSLS